VKISERLGGGGAPTFSFEFLPPKTDDGVAALYETVHELATLEPDFVSVTYGAGGSTRERTIELVTQIKQRTGVEAMAHLTCVGHGRAEIGDILSRYAAAGLENILALRGDPPRGDTAFRPAPDGFRYAAELLAFIRERHPLTIGAACYPEGHPECPSREDDLANLGAKVRAGADFLITQLFFDNAFYFDFVHRARAAGITVPIVPGIMPITSFESIERMTRMCGATIPMRLRLQLEKSQHDPEAILQLGVAHATVQCVDLLRRGAPGIHFYTLNRSRATRMIFAALRASDAAQAT
jgi:methylenetetrahydrofolate reductase (NADPH)